MPRDYTAPKLNRRIIIRREDDRPLFRQDEFGNTLGFVEYGTPVWAARRDVRVAHQVADGVPVESLTTIFTIRYSDRYAERGDLTVKDGASEFGVRVPQERGRRGASATHLELVSETRL